jgi:hypothetical protein
MNAYLSCRSCPSQLVELRWRPTICPPLTHQTLACLLRCCCHPVDAPPHAGMWMLASMHLWLVLPQGTMFLIGQCLG